MTDTPTITLWEWVNPQEFSPENGWVEDMVHSGRLRERTFQQEWWPPSDTSDGPLCPVWVEVTDE